MFSFLENQISYSADAGLQCLSMAASGMDVRVATVFQKTTGVIGSKRSWETAIGIAEGRES